MSTSRSSSPSQSSPSREIVSADRSDTSPIFEISEEKVKTPKKSKKIKAKVASSPSSSKKKESQKQKPSKNATHPSAPSDTSNSLKNKKSISAKMKKFEAKEGELKTKVEKQKKELVRLKAKQADLDGPKFPIKDELMLSMNIQNLVELPPILTKLPVSPNFATNFLYVWDFLVTFRKQLSLSALTIDQFHEVLTFTGHTSTVLVEIFSAPMRMILSDDDMIRKISTLIPTSLNFSYPNRKVDMDRDTDISFSSANYDSASNSLKLIPSSLHIQLLNPLTWHSILRSIITRLPSFRELVKTSSKLNDAECTKNLSINKIIRSGVDKDAIIMYGSDISNSLYKFKDIISLLDHKEVHELEFEHKLILLRILCDSCLDSDVMASYIEKNNEERSNRISQINKQIKEDKARLKEESSSKRDIAIAACRKINQDIAKAKSPKKNKKGGKTSIKPLNIDPTPAQVQAMLDDLILLESIGVDKVVESLPIDERFEMDESKVISRSNLRIYNVERERQQIEHARQLSLIDEANDSLIACLELHSEKAAKQAIKLGLRAGLRWKDEKENLVFCTENMKKVYKLLQELDVEAKENKQKSLLEKTLSDFPTRTLPIGSDRLHRQYYLFNNDNRLFVQERKYLDLKSKRQSIASEILEICDESSKLLFDTHPSNYEYEWGVISSKQDLWELYLALDDRGERESQLKSAILAKMDLQEPTTLYLKTGSNLIGRQVIRIFESPTRRIIGIITGWLPQQDDDCALWHVVHPDGDEEDLEEHEVLKCLVEESNSVLAENDDCDIEPVIIQSFTNTLRQHQSIKHNQIGFEGLRFELMKVHGMVVEGLKTAKYSVPRDAKKTFESLVRDCTDISYFISAVQDLEEFIRSFQETEDKNEEDELLRIKNENRSQLESEGWSFDKSMNEFFGRSSRRYFSDTGLSDAKIIGYLPAISNGNKIQLWLAEHSNGDEEELDEEELNAALDAFDRQLQAEDMMVIDNDEEIHDADSCEEPVNADEGDDSDDSVVGTLWPSLGVRSRWQKTLQNCKTISEISLALFSLLEYARRFGVVGVDPLDAFGTKRSRSFWNQSSPQGKKRSYDQLSSRPTREVTKRILSYYED